MKSRNSRWMKWVVEQSARETPPLPFARGKQRAQTIARRATATAFASQQASARHQDYAQA